MYLTEQKSVNKYILTTQLPLPEAEDRYLGFWVPSEPPSSCFCGRCQCPIKHKFQENNHFLFHFNTHQHHIFQYQCDVRGCFAFLSNIHAHHFDNWRKRKLTFYFCNVEPDRIFYYWYSISNIKASIDHYFCNCILYFLNLKCIFIASFKLY